MNTKHRLTGQSSTSATGQQVVICNNSGAPLVEVFVSDDGSTLSVTDYGQNYQRPPKVSLRENIKEIISVYELSKKIKDIQQICDSYKTVLLDSGGTLKDYHSYYIDSRILIDGLVKIEKIINTQPSDGETI